MIVDGSAYDLIPHILLAARFQAADCARLGGSSLASASASGAQSSAAATTRCAPPTGTRRGEANRAGASVRLPHSASSTGPHPNSPQPLSAPALSSATVMRGGASAGTDAGTLEGGGAALDTHARTRGVGIGARAKPSDGGCRGFRIGPLAGTAASLLPTHFS